MPRKHPKKGSGQLDPAEESFWRGYWMVHDHAMFAPLLLHTGIYRHEGNRCPENGWAVVTNNGAIHVHPRRRGDAREWAYILAHCLLHLGFGHFQQQLRMKEWNAACDCFVARFLKDLKLGTAPVEMQLPVVISAGTEERLYEDFCEHGIPEILSAFGTAGSQNPDMLYEAAQERSWHYRFGSWNQKFEWQTCFGKGLAMAVTSAVNVAGGLTASPGAMTENLTSAQKARAWFISSYPLLGSLAVAFDIVEDPMVCSRLNIAIAAVDAESKEIFVNPAAGLDELECRFVMAHELLHVGLRHQARCMGRDPYLWNVACDYVINGWLVEMGLGELPSVGALYDPRLKGESAERVYDRIVTDMRRCRKLATLRGIGLGDMLNRGEQDWWNLGNGIELDEFYRRCLAQGLSYHEEQGRGFLPAGLVEEIRALAQPPITWDVELARWFDHHFSPQEKRRSFARLSRRQSATPDIPRPRWVPALGSEDGRTFGVVLDTSGSMNRDLLAKALGTIASYSISRDVPAVRVVFCDAATYDQGYLPPEAIADRVKVKGRGGTILQPAIDLLEKAEDFPVNGPLLIITDGFCDRLHIRREHAFLMPEGRHLPFVAKGKVFRMK